MLTKWLGDAWDKMKQERAQMITNAFKRCGQYNDIYGRENHLIKVKGAPEYVAPEKDEQQS